LTNGLVAAFAAAAQIYFSFITVAARRLARFWFVALTIPLALVAVAGVLGGGSAAVLADDGDLKDGALGFLPLLALLLEVLVAGVYWVGVWVASGCGSDADHATRSRRRTECVSV
jgi:hypothetical protein